MSLSAATPGSVLPSSISRLAPPPVEMCVIWSARSASSIAAAESPPPMIVIAPGFGAVSQQLRDGVRACGESRLLEHAHRPVPDDGFGVLERFAEALAPSPGRCRRCPSPPGRPRRRRWFACLASLSNLSPITASTGSTSLPPPFCSRLCAVSTRVGFDQRIAHFDSPAP